MQFNILIIVNVILACALITLILLNALGIVVLGTIEGPSMEPLFQTGDLVVIIKSELNNIKPGDIIVFRKKNENGFVIHRVIQVINLRNATYYVTKGDNNSLPDYLEFEGPGIPSNRVIGKVMEVFNIPVKIPIIGYFSLMIRRHL